MNINRLYMLLNHAAMNTAEKFSLPLQSIFILILLEDRENNLKTLKAIIAEVERLSNTHAVKTAAERLIDDNFITAGHSMYNIGSPLNRFYSLTATGRDVLLTLKLETEKILKK